MRNPVPATRRWLFAGAIGLLLAINASESVAADTAADTAADSATTDSVTTDQPSAELMKVFLEAPETIYSNPATYQVFRDRKPIGSHSLRFERRDKELSVEVDSGLKVKMLGITVYQYRYQASELWSGGELVLLETTIKDNRKKPRVIKAESKGQYLSVEDSAKKEAVTAPLPEYGSNHWHPGAVFARRIFHTLHGRLYQGPPKDLGWERVVLDGGKVVSARKFSFSEGFNADVWYDSDWRWIKLSFRADDGSTIEYKCLDCGA